MRLTRLVETARDHFIASDPGLTRLALACRATLSVAVSVAVLYLITRATGQPVSLALFGAVVAMMSSTAVQDPARSDQRITTALMPLPAAISVTLGAVLASHRIVSDIAFLGVTFSSVFVRRFGPRWLAFGMVAFMAFFFALFLQATLSQLPWLVLAAVVAGGCTWLIRFVLFRDTPKRALRRTLQAFRSRIATMLGAAIDALSASEWSDPRRRRLRRRLVQLNSAALAVDDELDGVDPSTLADSVEALRLRVLDAELAAATVGSAAARVADAAADVPAGVRRELAGTLAVLRVEAPIRPLGAHISALAEGRGMPAVEEVRGEVPAVGQLHDAVRALALATERIRADQLIAVPDGRDRTDDAGDARHGDERGGGADHAGAGEGGAGVGADAGTVESEDSTQQGNSTDRGGHRFSLRDLSLTSRQAVQATLASAAAIVAGEFLSPQRWYWAMIAAFLVFTGTSSAGETATKAGARIVGTVGGVLAGIVAASVAAGNTYVELALVFFCIFCGYYLFRVAYSVMVFFITMLLALLYSLLGLFSLQLLTLRITETAVGAAIGGLVAAFVLPVRTRDKSREAIRDFLAEVSGSLRDVARAFGQPAGAQPLLINPRDVDGKLHELLQRSAPLVRGPQLIGHSGTRRWVTVLIACAHDTRSLSVLARHGSDVPPEWARERLAGAAARVADNVEAVCRRLNGAGEVSVETARGTLDAIEHTDDGVPDDTVAAGLGYLRHLDDAVIRLAHDLDGKPDLTERPTTPLPTAAVSRIER